MHQKPRSKNVSRGALAPEGERTGDTHALQRIHRLHRLRPGRHLNRPALQSHRPTPPPSSAPRSRASTVRSKPPAPLATPATTTSRAWSMPCPSVPPSPTAHPLHRYLCRGKTSRRRPHPHTTTTSRASIATAPERHGSESRPPLSDNTVSYWGQYVAVAVAETFAQANAAAAAVRVQYDADKPNVNTNLSDPMPAIGAPGGPHIQSQRGDPDAAFASAPVKIDSIYTHAGRNPQPHGDARHHRHLAWPSA